MPKRLLSPPGKKKKNSPPPVLIPEYAPGSTIQATYSNDKEKQFWINLINVNYFHLYYRLTINS